MHVTRARANMLREIFTRSSDTDPFQNEEIHEEGKAVLASSN